MCPAVSPLPLPLRGAPGRAVPPPAHSPAAGRGASGRRLPGRRGRLLTGLRRLLTGLRPPPHAAAAPPPAPAPRPMMSSREPPPPRRRRGSSARRIPGRVGGSSSRVAGFHARRFMPSLHYPGFCPSVKHPLRSLCWECGNPAWNPWERSGRKLICRSISLGIKELSGRPNSPFPIRRCAEMASKPLVQHGEELGGRRVSRTGGSCQHDSMQLCSIT